MKKYLLTALLGVFGLFGFVSAETFTFIDNSYSPSSFTIDEDFVLSLSSISSYNCDFTVCEIMIEGNTDECLITYLRDSIVDDFESCLLSSGTYILNPIDQPFSSISIDIPVASPDSGSSGTLLPNGTEDLRGIINGLQSTIAEFIPYVAYIGIGIIVACLGFVAIRRLVNWVRAKIFDNF